MGLENLESHPKSRFRDLRTLLGSDSSLPNLNRLIPTHLANAPFMRYLKNLDDGNDKDERDIYRDKVRPWVCEDACCWKGSMWGLHAG